MKTGLIKAKILQDKDIYEGANVAVFNPDKGYVEVSTIAHMTRDQWVTNNRTTILYGWELHELYIASNDDPYISIKASQWQKLISTNKVNSLGLVPYEVIPAIFRDGNTNMECQGCHCHFKGSPRQGLCIDCCNELATAKIINQKVENKTKNPTFTAPNINIKEMSMHAFEAGRYTDLDFDTWYNNQTK